MARAKRKPELLPEPLAAGAPLPWAHRIAILVVFALAALLATREVGSFDIGFHLRAGESILAGQGFPHLDTLTYSMRDHEYVDTSWLFQVITTLVHRAFGVTGMTLMVVGFVLATFGVLWRTARLLPADPTTLVTVLLLSVLACEMRFEPRPEVLSWLLLVSVLHVLHRHAEGLKSPLWLLPVLLLVWANAHALFVLGLAAIGCFGLGLFLRDRKLERRFVICAALAFAVPLVNPYGMRGALFPIELLSRMSEDNPFAQYIGEFSSPFDLRESSRTPFSPTAPLLAFRITAVLAVLSGLVLLVRRKWWCVLLLVAFLPLTFNMIRNMPLLPLAFAPALVWALPLEGVMSRLGLTALRRRALVTATAALLALYGVVMSLRVAHDAYYIESRRHARFGFGWNRIELPVGAAEHARRAGLRPPMLNHLNFGGYLGFALQQPVYIDGRLEVMGEDFFRGYMRSFATEEGIEALAKQWNAGWLVLPYATTPQLLLRTSRNPAWRLVHFDAVSASFARGDGSASRLVDPKLDLGGPAEETDAWKRLPGLAGNPRKSGVARWCEGVLHEQGFPTEDHYRGLFHYFRGEMPAARAHWLRGIASSEGRYYEMYVNLGAVLMRQHDYETARACFKLVLEEEPGNKLAKEKLAELATRASP